MEICGVNALCSVKNHSVSCSCPSGYRPDPDPYIRCKPYECLSHPECPTTLACENEQCVDPCKGNCARNADCSVIKHREICRCHPGYQGDPYGIACSPSKGFSLLNTNIFNVIHQKYVQMSIKYFFFSSTWATINRRPWLSNGQRMY